MIYQPEIETMGRAEMEALQLKRLQETVAYVYERVPMYKERLDALRVKPEDIQSLDDIRRLPFTVKDDLRDHYPYDLFAVPMKEIVRIHASSGTTGRPTVVGYTRDDIEMWSTCVARLAAAGGATDEDIAQISFGYGLFTGALGLHQGLSKIGAAVIPISSGNTERQINHHAQTLARRVLVATPCLRALHGGSRRAHGRTDGQDQTAHRPVRRGGLSTEEMRRGTGAPLAHHCATENYGMTELVGPGVSGRVHRINAACTSTRTASIAEDRRPRNRRTRCPIGERGELVRHAAQKAGAARCCATARTTSPASSRNPAPAAAPAMRMEKIAGRSDDMLIIRGVNVFPSQIESVLVGMEGIGPHYEIVVTTTSISPTRSAGQGGADRRNACWKPTASWKRCTKKIRDAAQGCVADWTRRSRLFRPTPSSALRARPSRVTDLR